MNQTLSVILPAHNEAEYIQDCARALLASAPLPAGWQTDVVIVANGCTDTTVALANGFRDAAEHLGWSWKVLDLKQGGKLGALQAGDATATGTIRAYLDADVQLDPDLLPQIVKALSADVPLYASGSPRVSRASSWITRAYARCWATLPFVTTGVPGFGLFAVNAKGRARWHDWPDIISDDTFVRLSFAPTERIRVAAGYTWPMVEGFANLVKVRRRQNAGVDEIKRKFPELMQNDDTPGVPLSGKFRRLICDPIGFGMYVTVSLAVKTPLFRDKSHWARGR
ncbi:glycosyl transferase [Phaeobacter gallaeciensis]|uniref:Glycosyl transferase n=2 Tax=Roseobacteraceae TaxID=2854170 RepID=A0A366X9N1_9RHOB|nr:MULTISPECIES: glycosyltransferase [Roseobacteraceae]MBT3142625.1 glycosyltransferase [Falsiruegeria litorea]MBT8168149.1 glycosyltransferase [Falsiruegeria litorea]RBW61613.1 glycosyl transferase [Phaeobacter gallaeciensis]